MIILAANLTVITRSDISQASFHACLLLAAEAHCVRIIKRIIKCIVGELKPERINAVLLSRM